ncbi:hypothetical protein, partial [Acinetobacter baumannii]|uniref:hypothetical protein n=1 Tax=Acinetobacter baumannii TaxID=470 RepID=UPI003AFA7BC3
LAIVLLISLPFFVFFRFGGMPRAKGLFRAKVSIRETMKLGRVLKIKVVKINVDFFHCTYNILCF